MAAGKFVRLSLTTQYNCALTVAKALNSRVYIFSHHSVFYSHTTELIDDIRFIRSSSDLQYVAVLSTAAQGVFTDYHHYLAYFSHPHCVDDVGVYITP